MISDNFKNDFIMLLIISNVQKFHSINLEAYRCFA
jgi:hypothetical protein